MTTLKTYPFDHPTFGGVETWIAENMEPPTGCDLIIDRKLATKGGAS